jgi:alpha-N-arabinofuranosidase
VAGSASLKDKTLFLTLTNAHAEQAASVEVSLLGGASAQSAQASILSGEIHAHNTFEQPEALMPQPVGFAVRGSAFTLEIPPASVAAMSIPIS